MVDEYIFLTNLYKFAMIRNSFSTLKINYFVVQKQDLGYLKSILNPVSEVSLWRAKRWVKINFHLKNFIYVQIYFIARFVFFSFLRTA